MPLRSWFSARVDGWRRQGISARSAFGFMSVVLVGVAVRSLSLALPLPELSNEMSFVCYWLTLLGILLLGLSDDPLRVGLGLLMFLSGFDLFYVAIEPSLVVTGLMGSIAFVVALAAAYLKASETVAGRGETAQW